MHGDCYINLTETDGTNNINNINENLRVSGAKQLKQNSIASTSLAVTIYADIPILKNVYITNGNELGIAMPAMQTMRCLGNENTKEYLEKIDFTYNFPDDDFWFIREAYNQFKLGDLNKARNILDKITTEDVKKLSRIPSACSKLYNLYFSGLVGMWNGLQEHLRIINVIINIDRQVFFDTVRYFDDMNFIDIFLEKSFDLAEELFKSRSLITIAKYLQYSIIDINNYQLTHDSPDQFFHLYSRIR
jgi:hypothetical protein